MVKQVLKKCGIIVLVLSVSFSVQAKKYKFVFNPPFEIEQVRVAQQGTKFVKSWAVAGNPDKAIIQAKQNAVAAMLFTGIAPNPVMGAGVVQPLCIDPEAYEKNREYFDKFFKEGHFLNYAIDVNSTYPTGENNIKCPEGRKVGVYLQLLYYELRHKLEEDGIIKKMGELF